MLDNLFSKLEENKKIILIIIFFFTFIFSFIYFSYKTLHKDIKISEKAPLLESTETLKLTLMKEENIKENMQETYIDEEIYLKKVKENETNEKKVKEIFNVKEIKEVEKKEEIKYIKFEKEKRIKDLFPVEKTIKEKGIFIQVFSSNNINNINNFEKQLKINGFIYKLEHKETITKIIVGPFADEELARENMLKINDLFNIKSFIVKK